MKVRLNEKKLTSSQLHELILKETNKQVNEQLIDVAVAQTKEVVAGFMLLFYEQKWHKDRVQKYFDLMCELYQRPAFFGKKVTGSELIDFIAKKYDVDFDKLQPHFEV